MASRLLLTKLRSGPPVLWRTARWCLLLACLSTSAAVALAAVLAYMHAPRPQWMRYATMAFGFAPIAVIYPVGHILHIGVRRSWRRNEGMLCTNCAHCVKGLADAGVCPECGARYDIAADAELWRNAGLGAQVAAPRPSPKTR